MKTLIIRTDKLGDFYQTLPYINAIKRTNGKENLDLLISEEIYDHIAKKEYLYNNIYSFPKRGILRKVILIFKLRKKVYNQILVLDSKDRSLILSFFLKSIKKIILYEKRKINYLFRLLLNKNDIIKKDKKETDSKLFKEVLYRLDIENKPIDYNLIKYIALSEDILPTSLLKIINKYTLIHLDEKWFSEFYIKGFYDIGLSINSFLEFINNFFISKKQNIIITTGLIKLPFIEELCVNVFTPIQDNFYEYNYNNQKAILIIKNTFTNLEIFAMNSKNLITCHTSLSFIAASFDVNLIDIIDKNKDIEYNYNRHTSHIKKYNKIYRKKFNQLYKEILLKIEQ